MEYGLIMENWRQYQTLEDNSVIFENKKISYDGLLLRLNRSEVDPMIFLETLDAHISKKCDLFMNKLNENMFTDGFKSLALKALKFVLSAVDKIRGFLDSVDYQAGAAVYKIAMKCFGVINKVMTLVTKISKAIGPIGRVAVFALIIMIFFVTQAAASTAGVEMDPDVLNVTLKLLEQLTAGNEGGASELVINQTMGSTDVFVNGAQIVSDVKDYSEILGNENNSVDKAIRSAAAIIQKLSGEGPIMQEDFIQFVDKLDSEVALNIDDGIRVAERMKSEDPEHFATLADAGKKLKVVFDGSTESVIENFKANISKDGVKSVVDSVTSTSTGTMKSRFDQGI